MISRPPPRKIDCKAIGVGLYQHDVDQKRLAEAGEIPEGSKQHLLGC